MSAVKAIGIDAALRVAENESASEGVGPERHNHRLLFQLPCEITGVLGLLGKIDLATALTLRPEAFSFATR